MFPVRKDAPSAVSRVCSVASVVTSANVVNTTCSSQTLHKRISLSMEWNQHFSGRFTTAKNAFASFVMLSRLASRYTSTLYYCQRIWAPGQNTFNSRHHHNHEFALMRVTVSMTCRNRTGFGNAQVSPCLNGSFKIHYDYNVCLLHITTVYYPIVFIYYNQSGVYEDIGIQSNLPKSSNVL